MNLVHTAICGALVAALELSATSVVELRTLRAGDLWQIPQTPVSPRDAALGNNAPDLRRESAETPRTNGNSALGRWFSRAPNDGPSAGTSAVTPPASAAGSANKPPQPTLNQRIAQWRLARIEKVRGQLLKQSSGVGSADTANRWDPPSQPFSPAPTGPAMALQAPQVDYGAPANRTAMASPQGPSLTAPKVSEPSHEVTIDLPDETEGPKPKGSLSSRLRGGR